MNISEKSHALGGGPVHSAACIVRTKTAACPQRPRARVRANHHGVRAHSGRHALLVHVAQCGRSPRRQSLVRQNTDRSDVVQNLSRVGRQLAATY